MPTPAHGENHWRVSTHVVYLGVTHPDSRVRAVGRFLRASGAVRLTDRADANSRAERGLREWLPKQVLIHTPCDLHKTATAIKYGTYERCCRQSSCRQPSAFVINLLLKDASVGIGRRCLIFQVLLERESRFSTSFDYCALL